MIGRPKGNRPIGKPWGKLKWVDNIEIGLKDMRMWTGCRWTRFSDGVL